MGKVIIEWAALLLSLSMFPSIHAMPSCKPCATVCSPEHNDLSPYFICTKNCECVKNGASLFIDDMKIDPNVQHLLIKSMEIDGEPAASQTPGGAGKDAGNANHVLRWDGYSAATDNGTVQWRIPYVIGNVSSIMRTPIEESFADYEANICMEFVERTTEQSYLHFMDDGDGGCWSYVGRRVEGVNYINLGSSGCAFKGVVIHEIMHAMGFFHEHQRPDRDNYVIVHWDNIESSASTNFNKIDYQYVDNYIMTTVPYDFGSVMHYPDYAFSTSDAKTLTDLNSNGFTAQRSGFASSDIAQLRLMFQCEGVALPSTGNSSGSVKRNPVYHAAILTILVISEFLFTMVF